MSTEERAGHQPLERMLAALEAAAAEACPAVPSAVPAREQDALPDLAGMLAPAHREEAAGTVGQTREPGTPATTGAAAPVPGVAAALAAIDAGETTAAELVERSLARIGERAGLNAFAHVDAPGARRRAEAVDRRLARAGNRQPLAGVPIGHKDIILTRGLPTRAGSALLASHVPDRDAEVVRRLAAAGAVSLGKLNTHEFATGVTGLVSASGPTLNPWRHDRVPGGSSAGSAAAVAARLIAGATATDTGGSIRIPSACCGTVGLKPTYDLVSRDGVIPFAHHLDHVGPIAGRVYDARLLLAQMAEPTLSAELLAAPEPPVARIGVLESTVEDSTADVAGLIRALVGELPGAGIELVGVRVPTSWSWTTATAMAIFLREGGRYHRAGLERHPDLYQEATRRFLAQARRVSASAYAAARTMCSRIAHETETLLQQVDVLLLPTLPCVAPAIDAETVELPQGRVDTRAALTRFTRPFNLTGLPALSVPCGLANGLPVAVQLVGRPFAERLLLDIGRRIESLRGPLPEPPRG